MQNKITIREEKKEDYQAIRFVNDKAFNQPQEGNVVNKLRNNCPDLLSLVALQDDKIVGHILFSPVTLDNHPEIKGALGLAPISVLPEYQNQGIGSMLIKTGLKKLQTASVPFIIVLGHKKYYPKFGFELASKYGFCCQWERVPDEAFMIIIFDHKSMKYCKGIIRYRDEFNEAI